MTTEELRARLELAGIAVPPSGMLRAAQVCVILDVAPNTLAAWRRQGRPPSGVPLNGRHYYDLQALAAFMSGES